MTDETRDRFVFDRCEIVLDRRELLRDGTPQQVEPQVFDLICLLVRAGGRVVSHDELIAEIWGGRIVSDAAISARISAARAAIGDDGTSQRLIRTVPRRGFRFVGEIAAIPPSQPQPVPAPPPEQHIHFCRSRDGTRIAWATTGNGQALVKAGTWLTHLEHDWQSPIWQPFLARLQKGFAVTRYDQRGNGLSDWEAGDLSLDRFVEDLEAVVDAAGLDRFVLYGTSQGAPISVAYAARHPDRVARLILHGGYAQGRLMRSEPAERATGEAVQTLIRLNWGKPGTAFLKSFAASFLPEGDKAQIDSLAELQRLTTSPANAARLREAVDRFDVVDLLVGVACPTLVVHAREDGVHPLDQGRRLAAGIPGAELMTLDTANHVLVPQEPGWEAFFSRLEAFAGEPGPEG